MKVANDGLAGVVSPNPADAELAVSFLGENGIAARAFPDLLQAAAALDESVGCLILVEEALIAGEIPALREAIRRRPAWSDLPLVVVARDVAALGDIIGAAFADSGNVTLLERPLNPHTLVSATQVALRAAARQREVGELIAQREHAVNLRDEFLAMLAHELRNPLAPIANSVQIMQMLRPADPDMQKSIEVIGRQVKHLVRMVDDLMDVARMERGKVALKRQRLDLNRLVASAIETCLEGAREKGHRVNVRFGTAAIPVDADAVRIEQIVCNLVNNAVKFSPRPGEIRVETSAEAGCGVVAVEDGGIGFSPAAAPRLFDPFVQVNPTLERSAGGLGMGLTIVKRLVELHGGSVEAHSEGAGKGARFVVRLPLAAGAVEPASPARQPGGARRRRIVIVEDNLDIRETLRVMLTMWGHEVTMAGDGRAGVERVLEDRPDVALIDIGLPEMNGYDVARAIRARLPDGRLRLIALTGYGQPADRELALQAGFDAHLLKPVAADVLQRELVE
jgi:signal transduction histidine kinase